MSDDLIQRIKTFAGKIQAEKILIDPYDGSFYANPTGSFSRSGRDLLIEAADTLASKDTALAEIRAEHSAARENFHTMQHAANALRQRAEAAESELALVKKALEPFGRAEERS